MKNFCILNLFRIPYFGFEIYTRGPFGYRRLSHPTTENWTFAMPTYTFEAMDATGQEIRDEIEAPNEDKAQETIRQMGYFVTKISVKKSRKSDADQAKGGKKRGFAVGGVSSKNLTTFTRQLSILQDAGLPILRSLKILEEQCKPGRLKNSLMDTCEEIEGGSTLSEAMSKAPKCFNRLYVNMIKAGEAGGALEVILRRLADFMEKAEALKRKVKGAMVYPVVVVMVAVGILTFIMIKIVPTFETIFADFETPLPAPTVMLVAISQNTAKYWYLIPGIPDCHCFVPSFAEKVQTWQTRLGLVRAERARVWAAGGEKFAGSSHPNVGDVGAERCSDS